MFLCVCVCARVRAHACVRACVRACVCVCVIIIITVNPFLTIGPVIFPRSGSPFRRHILELESWATVYNNEQNHKTSVGERLYINRSNPIQHAISFTRTLHRKEDTSEMCPMWITITSIASIVYDWDNNKMFSFLFLFLPDTTGWQGLRLLPLGIARQYEVLSTQTYN